MIINGIDTSDKVYVIAEIGNNHEGDFELAQEMVRLAAQAGADAVKFQTITPIRLVSPSESLRIQQLTQFQFSPEQFRKLSAEAEKNNVAFLSTPFDLDAVEWLNPLVPAFKIASGDNDFWPLIDRVLKTEKPLIISTGLGRIRDIDHLISFIKKSAKNKKIKEPELALLHCVASYPTPLESAGLFGIFKLAKTNFTVGYSDHTIGIRAAELAVAAGARIVEKHFTIDNDYSDFRDHQMSADPEDLKKLVDSIREIEKIFGSDVISEQDCEKTNIPTLRRSIAAVREMSQGTTVEWNDICWLRPQTGLKPGQEHMVCGKILKVPIAAGEIFTPSHFE